MIEILSVENMRKSDAHTIETVTSGRELMMRAGRAVFENVEWKPPVAIVCGTGNNAGDGYVIAALLYDAGIPCTLVLLEEKFSEDGKYYFEACRERNIEVKYWQPPDVPDQKDDPENRSNSGGTGDRSCHINEKELHVYSTIVDCIFGTGFKGSIETGGNTGNASGTRGKAAEVVNAINSSDSYVVSVDINSGLNGDSGMSVCCVISDLTVSIGSFKPGHFLNMAKDVIKRKINCDIGITPVDKPFYLLEKSDIEPLFTPRRNYSNKGTYGYTALIGGSKRYSGAIRLAAMAHSAIQHAEDISADNEETAEITAMAGAAMRSGAGVVKIAVADSLCPVVAPAILESTLFPLSDDGGNIRFVESEIAELISNVKTVAFGMGIGVTEETAKILDYLLENYTGRLIVDADGLTLLSKLSTEKIRNAKPELVLTPHIREFSRLLAGWTGDTAEMTKDHDGISTDINDILSTPIEYAQKYARAHKVVLLLKGPSTIITNGDITYITDAGCAGMATAGSGDVLSGILAAVCAYLPDVILEFKKNSVIKKDIAGSVDPDALTLAVAAGAYINGKAGEAAQEKTNSISMVASDTVACITEVISGIMVKKE